MSGDYTRFTFDPAKRFSGVLMQQGRVQLDSDWNEEIDILRRRIRTTTLDILGPVGVPYAASPDAFKIGWIAGPPADLSIEPGRLYVDGVQVEAFAADGATYNNQPFAPPPLAGFPLPPLPAAGDAVVYLDIWDREITYIEDPALLDPALGGADTATRRQTVWQLRVDPVDNAACGATVGPPPSAGRMSARAIAPPAPDDPCILPPASGYRGLENRLYRIEIHDAGALGAARFKWSRDNGSIVSAVSDIAVSGAQTTLTVNRIGRDQFLRFRAGDWVTVTDDHRELMGEPGVMALVLTIDETNRRIVLDRALPAGGRPFGPTAGDVATRRTRVQRWDQTAAANAVDGDGLIAAAAGPIPIEDGVEVEFSTDPAGGEFRAGDYWLIWARAATATVDTFIDAPPRGILHRYVQLAAINGLGGAADPAIADCRPPPPQQGTADCCCTIIVRPGENIQAGIDALPDQGGCVCLKTGLHVIREPLRIARGNIALKAESPGATVRLLGDGPALTIGNPAGFRVEAIDVLGIDFETAGAGSDGEGVVMIVGAARVRVSHCGMRADQPAGYAGLHAIATDALSVAGCRIREVAAGVLVQTRCENFTADENHIDLRSRGERGDGIVAIAYVESAFPCRITRNALIGGMFGVLVNDAPFGDARSLADLSFIADNFVICPRLSADGASAFRPAAIDVAAAGCVISGNRVRYADRAYVGIRSAGSFCTIRDNILTAFMRGFDILGPIAIQIGAVREESQSLVIGAVVSGNAITGAQHGVVCIDATELIVGDNLIEGLLARGGFALLGVRVRGSLFSGNRVGGMLSAALLAGGAQNRIAANDARLCFSGVSLLEETGPQIVGNRLDQLGLWGVFAMQIAARLDIVENRLVRCGVEMERTAFAVGAVIVLGEAHIAGNEIMDTGSDGGEQARTTADYGVFGDLILEARISGNLVTYSNVFSRNALREDRALIMRGLLDIRVNDILVLGAAAQIDGNKFIGTGRTALIQLLESPLTDNAVIRFERVSFSQNYCMHLSPPNINERVATVSIVGRFATVMGNHVKATTPKYFSVHFNGMKGPYMGNVTTGPTLQHTDFPAPASAFNILS